MRNNYFKFFAVLALLLNVGVGEMWGGNRRIYFDYSLISWWENDDCITKAHAWNGSGLVDQLMSAVEGESSLLYCDIDDSYTSVCFNRRSSDDKTDHGWTSTWTIGSNNRFKVKDYWGTEGDDKGKICKADANNAIRWTPGVAIDGLLDPLNPHTQAFNEDGEFSVSLTANTAYEFKVLDNTTLYGCGTRDYDYTYVGQTDSVLINTSSGNKIMLLTATGGTYTFGWCSSTKKLKITYPDAPIKHPNMDYVYMEKYSDWNGGSYTHIHYWHDADHPLTDGGVDPKITTSTYYIDARTGKGDKNFYTYPILSYYPNFKVAQGLNGDGGGASGHATGDMDATGHEGHYVYWKDKTEGWVWATIQVYIELENNGADVNKGDLGRNVAFNDTSMNTAIVCPQKSHYDFGGYYTEDGGAGTQIILDNGKWKKSVTDYTTADTAWIHAGDTTVLYAKWTKHPYTINLAVEPAGAGTISPSGATMSAYNDQPSGDITATPSHAAWKFKEWRFSKVGESDYDVYVTNGETYHSTDATIQVYAKRNGTLTAVFEPRFTLVGATQTDRNVASGMPGWSNYTAEFTVNSTDPLSLTCTCSLLANTWYQCEVHDRVRGNLGDGTDGLYEITKAYKAHCTGSNMDMKFRTTGAGKYVFEINQIDDEDYPYLQLYWPWQVQYGWKYQDADAGSLSEGGGGSVSVYAHEGGEKRAIVSSGGYIMHGGTVSYTAHPYNDYQLAGWWNDYGFSNKTNMNGDSVHWTVTSEDAKLYAKFVEKTDTLKSGTTWSTDANWSMGSQPTADIVAVIKSPVQVDITTAKAKKVLIMQNSPNTGQLEIPAGKELVVRTTIRKTTDGSTYGATGENDIIIGSTLAEGNGALVMGAHDGTNKATVYFATKAKTVEQDGKKHNVNQFIGTPFNDENDILYDYYGTKIYEFKAAHDGNKGTYNEWQRVASTGQQMLGFKGYNILTNQTESPVLEMTGTLSRTNTTETIDGYYNGSSNTENMFANSWVAPIYIPNFKDTCFVNIEKTIYIFNAGTPKDQEGHAMGDGTAETEAAGQYSVLPANSSVYTGLKVIPSMQAFSVFAKGENPKLKFDYNELVNNPSNGTAGIVPNRAPQRTYDEDAPNVLRLAATGESGYAAKIVLLERTDFTEGYDDGWDGRFLAGDDAAPQLYAVTSDGNMAINCSPEVEGTVLGFKAGEADEVFTFSFDYDGEALYLYDTQTQTYTRVLTGNTYTFTTNDLAAHNRFILTYNAPQMPTVITNTLSDTKAVKFIENDHLYIFQNGRLYDAAGRIVK